MEFFKINVQTCCAVDFVSFWSKRYDEGKYSDADYVKNLNRRGLLSPDNLQRLFEWKNANPLSKKKQVIVDKAKKEIARINAFRQLTVITVREFDDFWSFASAIIESGIVFKVFLFHVARPDDYPMVDQHVLRGWNFLVNGRVEEPKQNLENYKKYRAFFLELAKQSGMGHRNIDQALMTFGQFLNSQFFLEEARANL